MLGSTFVEAESTPVSKTTVRVFVPDEDSLYVLWACGAAEELTPYSQRIKGFFDKWPGSMKPLEARGCHCQYTGCEEQLKPVVAEAS